SCGTDRSTLELFRDTHLGYVSARWAATTVARHVAGRTAVRVQSSNDFREWLAQYHRVVSGSPARNARPASVGDPSGQLSGSLMPPVPIAGSAGGEEIIIRPTSEALRFDLGELLRYRHLFWALV